MKRREFIAGLGSAGAWPLVARAQPQDRLRRVGVLLGNDENDRLSRVALTLFREGLEKLGWFERRNLQIDVRYGGGNVDAIRIYAVELLQLVPDVLVASSAATTRALQQQTRATPIVMVGAGDVAVNGIVKDVAHPERNVTGVTNLYGSVGGKWLELIREAAPGIQRIALIGSDVAASSFVPSIQEAERALAVEVTNSPFSDAVDIVRAIDAFGAKPNGALILIPPLGTVAYRHAILRLATQYRLPTIYGGGTGFAQEGGLIYYGADLSGLWQRAPAYVDHILRGAKVNELPIEFPTKFQLIINLNTAKSIGLTIPETLLVRADEVIE
jgi:putative ABC transport system substrate-binding protein